jgi:hypothetical protein
MIIELTLKKDENCLGLKYDHYTFGTVHTINGGVYIEKGHEVPEQIVLTVKG